MKIKKEYIVLAVIIVALSLYLIFQNRDRNSYQLPKIAKVAGDDVTKIEIIKGNQQPIRISKAGSEWEILPKKYPADAARIKAMLDVISGLKLTALVSESKNYPLYDLDDTNRIHVKAWIKDKVALEFDTGKAASSFRHTFVKLPGDPMVYHARDNFRRKFDLSINELRDKKVLAFDKDTIHEIRIQKGEEELLISRRAPEEEKEADKESGTETDPEKAKKPAWVTEKNEAIDDAALQRLLSTLADLKCENYMEGDNAGATLANPILHIVLQGEKAYELSLFDKIETESASYPAISSENPYAFLLPSWRVEALLKAPDEMLKKQGK